MHCCFHARCSTFDALKDEPASLIWVNLGKDQLVSLEVANDMQISTHQNALSRIIFLLLQLKHVGVSSPQAAITLWKPRAQTTSNQANNKGSTLKQKHISSKPEPWA